MSTLEHAIALAAKAHEGKRDKGGAPYIFHPLRMMLRFKTEAERITAVLHDVVEDCEGWSSERIRQEGFSEEIVKALISVTKIDGESYDDFVRRAAANPIGRCVKLADLHDNSDITRIPNPTDDDYKRTEKYLRAIAIIEQGMTIDLPTIRLRALESVMNGKREMSDLVSVDELPSPVYNFEPVGWALFMVMDRASMMIGGAEYVAVHLETGEVRHLGIIGELDCHCDGVHTWIQTGH